MSHALHKAGNIHHHGNYGHFALLMLIDFIMCYVPVRNKKQWLWFQHKWLYKLVYTTVWYWLSWNLEIQFRQYPLQFLVQGLAVMCPYLICRPTPLLTHCRKAFSLLSANAICFELMWEMRKGSIGREVIAALILYTDGSSLLRNFRWKLFGEHWNHDCTMRYSVLLFIFECLVYFTLLLTETNSLFMKTYLAIKLILTILSTITYNQTKPTQAKLHIILHTLLEQRAVTWEQPGDSPGDERPPWSESVLFILFGLHGLSITNTMFKQKLAHKCTCYQATLGRRSYDTNTVNHWPAVCLGHSGEEMGRAVKW